MNEVDKWFSDWSGQHESEVTAELSPDVLVRMRQQMFTEEDIPVGDESDIQLLRWEQRVHERAQRDRQRMDNMAGEKFKAEAKIRRLQREVQYYQILNAALWGLLTLSLAFALWGMAR